MNRLNKIKKIINEPQLLIAWLSYNTIFRLPSKMYLNILYKKKIGDKINWKHPIAFNEKLQWLKVYDKNPNYTQMVDKIEVKKYLVKYLRKEGIKNPEQYLIPTIKVYDNFEDINFDKLPKRFVMKCTHDSGGTVICKDKERFLSNKEIFTSAKKKIQASLKRNYYWKGREWPYKNVKPRIIIEEYMENSGEEELSDYKFMCFNGEVKMIFTCTERYADGLKVTFFDTQWKKMPFERHYPASKKEIKKPKNLKKMIELAEILSKDIPFVRVDFYEINGKIYFGELTFYPGTGMEEFTPKIWDKKIGEWIKLPNEK